MPQWPRYPLGGRTLGNLVAASVLTRRRRLNFSAPYTSSRHLSLPRSSRSTYEVSHVQKLLGFSPGLPGPCDDAIAFLRRHEANLDSTLPLRPTSAVRRRISPGHHSPPRPATGWNTTARVS